MNTGVTEIRGQLGRYDYGVATSAAASSTTLFDGDSPMEGRRRLCVEVKNNGADRILVNNYHTGETQYLKTADSYIEEIAAGEKATYFWDKNIQIELKGDGADVAFAAREYVEV